jgi:hypothetical protein
MRARRLSEWLRRIWGRDPFVGSSKLEPDERMCPGTGEATTCMADCHPLGENCEDLHEAEDQVIAIGYTPEAVIVAPAEGDIKRGDPVEIGPDGMARRVDSGAIVGVALGGNRIRLTPGRFDTQERRGMEMSWDRQPVGSIAYGSMAYHASIIGGPGRGFPRAGGPARYQYNEQFPKEVVDKAMKLLEKFMNPDQYKAFMEGSLIELQNKAEDHRIMFNRNGKFSILKGPRGAGITMTSGNIGSFKYPLGDEIAVFLDWFNHRTLELIDRWRCGTYTIKDGDLR